MKTNREIVDEIVEAKYNFGEYHRSAVEVATAAARAGKLEALAACAWLLENGTVEAALLEIQRIALELEGELEGERVRALRGDADGSDSGYVKLGEIRRALGDD